jgi:hypothetical protein
MIVCGKQIRVENRGLFRMARLDAEKYHFLEDPEPTLEALCASGARIDLFTFMQRLPETQPKYAYPMEWDNFAALPVSTFEHWWNKQLGFKARNKAKQAEKKGVVIREVSLDDNLVEGIWKIYNECPVRQGRRFPHYGKSLEEVRREESTYLDYSQFVGAFLEDELIGFIKLLADETNTQAGLLNIVSMIKHRDKAPTNALVARAVRICAARKISYLVYSNFAYGAKQSDSLSDFKERNAFQRIDVPRYFVPLTSVGAAAFRLGLHRRLVERFPEALAAKLRELRTAWYARRFQTVRESS